MKQPSVQLRQDRYYHLRYDAISLVASLAVIVAATPSATPTPVNPASSATPSPR